MQNDTSDFILLEFSKIWKLQIMYIVLFLMLYIITVTGNLLIITAVICDYHLHTPMYFFLINLACQDIGSVSVIIPKAVFNSIMNVRYISYSGCIAQMLLFVFFLSTNISLFTVMAYDRYIAICRPLQYEMIMNRKVCTKMIGSVWLASLLNALLHTSVTFKTPFCSNIINQFYCEIPYLLRIACSDSYMTEIGVLIFTGILSLCCFTFVIVTYVHLFSAVLRIPSTQGRKKAFSTCLPHLVVLFIFMFTGCFAYLSVHPSDLDFIITIMYSIIPPMMNPFIYSIRNRDIKVALSRLLDRGHFILKK